jgi:antirestriction protein
VIGSSRFFYDLRVQQDAGYIAAGLVVHNCEICGYLAGKTFQVKHAVAQREKMLAAASPEDVKAAAPWLQTSQIVDFDEEGKVTGGKSPAELAAMGIACPPFHGRCRCQLDIADSEE